MEINHNHFFGIRRYAKPRIRKIAVVEGRFTRTTHLGAELYYVNAGEIIGVNGFGVGRSRDMATWPKLTITLALADVNEDGVIRTRLTCAGHRRGAGSSTECKNKVQLRDSVLLTGTIGPQSRILYVEGDRMINVDRQMTLEEFANNNRGEYLVVMASMD